MRFHKKEAMVKFGEFDPILYSDQKELSESYRKNRELSREERLILYRDSEYKRIVKEKDKINKIIILGWILAFTILIITIIMYYMNILNESFILVNTLFVIDIFFTIYLYFKQYNKYDKLRERDLYLAILDIKKNISDLSNLIENINKKTKT